ncbi:hypothetical protein TanjilG_13467 [Lupinus angustifolius]|uniref:Transmembrane protein n=1 Tax=Lupinus angustifolius TaxID=3871 RepID=A0A4P1RV94_LUPAN|nr:PREDICTED: uncharacterized protein LOC109356024 [Lupinus angustifolius]OIW18715.1 hypothetical protein TanjilG_13467 [Lupinus angustifolius]
MSDTPPPVPPTDSALKRTKFIWRLLLVSNFALGAYMFASAKRRDSTESNRRREQKSQKGKATVEVPAKPITVLDDFNYDDFLVTDTTPVQVRDPIPEEQQREIFKWMLEEKRKVKPKDPVEKKQNDQEKATLKKFLSAESIPKF